MFKERKSVFTAIIVVFALLLTFSACKGGGAGGSSGGGGNSGENGGNQGGADGIPGSMSAYVSTSLTDEYAYELAFESGSSPARAAAHAPKEDGFYSLIVYDVKDGKVKGVSEGKIKGRNGGLTLKPNDTNDPDITVTVSGGEMTEINGKTNKGGKHDLPGKVKPFKQTEGVSGDFRYATNPGNTVTITKHTGNGGAVTIPEKIDGKTVIGIGFRAFVIVWYNDGYSTNENITSVTIPNSVTSIGYGAFHGCTSLTSVTIPNSVISIGNEAFFSCTSLTGITIPNGVTSIGSNAFHGCTSLTAINVDAGNTAYSSQDGVLYNKAKTALIHCPRGITGAITIPNSVTTIEEGAFAFTSLASVTIPNSVTEIGASAFYNCTSLAGGVTIPNSVTSIGMNAFSGCTSLASVTIGNSVTSIGEGAFASTGLTSVTIPNSVISIGEEAFYNCTSLAGGVTIPNSVTSIGASAFYNCTSLISITIGNGVTSIGYRAFFGCTSLAAITVDSGNTAYSSQDGVLYNKIKTYLIQYPAKKTGAFIIPDSVTRFSTGAFRGCTSLVGSVTIPNGVTQIDEWVFEGCTSLTSITIPSSVYIISKYAFSGCTSLTSVTFQGGIYSNAFEESAFMGDLRKKYIAGGGAGGIGTYKTTAPVSWNSVWTKQ